MTLQDDPPVILHERWSRLRQIPGRNDQLRAIVVVTNALPMLRDQAPLDPQRPQDSFDPGWA
ncbi:MAG: hypothetical protein NVS2B16_03980 [Chloroflexota bacterium]